MDSMNPSLMAELQELIASGQLEQARERLRRSPAARAPDAALHKELGLLAEQLGELPRAVTEYNLALRDAPDQPEVLLRLARLRTDQGELERAARAYRRLLDLVPTDARAALELGGVLEDLGRSGEAQQLYAESFARAQDPRLQQAGRRLARSSSAAASEGAAGQAAWASLVEAPDAATAGGPRPADELHPSDADLITFSSVFAGREGVYARQWASPTGKHGYTPVREPFTPSVARNHLLGAYTVGIYPVRMDGTVLFAAVDLDVAGYALSRAGHVRGGVDALLGRTQQMALRLVDAAASLDLPVYLESSGWKGRHVWLLFAAPVPAAAARRIGQALLERAGPMPPDVTAELFPKQSRVAEGGLGNLIKLPLGVHRVTGARGLFVDLQGRPMPDQLDVLRQLRRVTREQLAEALGWVGRGKGPLREPAAAAAAAPAPPSPWAAAGGAEPDAGAAAGRGLPEGVGVGPADLPPGRVVAFPRSPAGRPTGPPGAAPAGAPRSRRAAPATAAWPDEDGWEGWDGWEGDADADADADVMRGQGVPEEEPYSPEEDLELLWLAEHCPVLAEVLQRARGSRVLSNEERLVLTYTVGHLASGPQAVNAILSQTFNVDPSAFLKSRLRGNPMSCPKIRCRVPEIAAGVSCDCRFDPSAGLYPTPLLHLQGLRAREASERGPARISALQVERWIGDLYRLRAQIERSRRLAHEIEERLLEMMDEQGLGQLATSLGVLRLEQGPDGRSLSLALPLPGAQPEAPPGSKALCGPRPANREVQDAGAVRDRAGSEPGAGAGPPGGAQGA